jgi:hypothetical protein
LFIDDDSIDDTVLILSYSLRIFIVIVVDDTYHSVGIVDDGDGTLLTEYCYC